MALVFNRVLRELKRLPSAEKKLRPLLPAAYQKFWREWKLSKPAVVTIVPRVLPESFCLLEQLYFDSRKLIGFEIPRSANGDVNEKKSGSRKRLRRKLLYSEVLKEFVPMSVDGLILAKIDESYGFDHYLLKHPACILDCPIALKTKRKILLELLNGCPKTADNPEVQAYILKEYKRYLASYTAEEIEWYGLTYEEAVQKMQTDSQVQERPPTKPVSKEDMLRLINEIKKIIQL